MSPTLGGYGCDGSPDLGSRVFHCRPRVASGTDLVFTWPLNQVVHRLSQSALSNRLSPDCLGEGPAASH